MGQLLDGVDSLFMGVARMGCFSVDFYCKADKSLSSCLQISVCRARLAHQRRLCVLRELADDLGGLSAAGLLIAVEDEFQSLSRIDSEVFVCFYSPDCGYKTALHVVDTRSVKLVSFRIVFQRADEVYCVIMANKQDLLRTASVLEPYWAVSILRLIDEAVFSRALLDQHHELFTHLRQCLDI